MPKRNSVKSLKDTIRSDRSVIEALQYHHREMQDEMESAAKFMFATAEVLANKQPRLSALFHAQGLDLQRVAGIRLTDENG
jgi:hypothetical protein